VTLSTHEAAGQQWDLVVVGAGTAGIVGARTAASLGARVLVVEADRTGGDCLWTGCVPSKALLAAAHRVASARSAGVFGVHVDGVRVDFAGVMGHVRRSIATIEPVDSAEALEAAGVSVLRGWATLTGSSDVEVAGHRLSTRQVLLATGSGPALPDLPGLRTAKPWTSDTVWDLEQLPSRLTVVGGGSVGCELGQAFARLGARVTVLEQAPQLLPAEDPDAAAAVAVALRADGVGVRTGAGLGKVLGTAENGTVRTTDGRVVEHDALLVALGRHPRTRDVGLHQAGVEVDRRGFVRVDRALRTSNPRVWAAGDLTGHPQFTHLAGVHASLAASNAVLGLRRRAETVTVPRVTYTTPEVAAVGVGVSAAAGSRDLRVVTRWHHEVDRAVVEGDTAGFARLVIDGKGRVVGATLVGPRAGESLSELVLAVRQGLRTRDLAGATHPYPTYADGAWNAAIADVRARLGQPAARRATALLATTRRSWLDLRGRLSGRGR